MLRGLFPRRVEFVAFELWLLRGETFDDEDQGQAKSVRPAPHPNQALIPEAVGSYTGSSMLKGCANSYYFFSFWSFAPSA